MLIDAHVHLDKYADLLDQVLQEIEQKRIFTVATAMDIPSYLELQKIGERSELVLPTFGVHPRRAADYADRLQEIGRCIESSPAIGEIGLDFHWVKDTNTYPAQRKVLEYFIAAAREQNKFVNLHTKGGEKEILDQNVVDKVAELRQSTPERIENLVHANFLRMIEDDPWLYEVRSLLLPSNS